MTGNDGVTIAENILNAKAANSFHALTERGMSFIIENCRKVLHYKQVQGPIDQGYPSIDAWADSQITCLGCEPLFRILFRLFRTLNTHDIMFAWVVVEDPVLFLTHWDQGDVAPYYEVYPY